MSIAPIIRTVRVNPPPARAFELFAARMGDWWPGATVGKKQHVAVVIEPREGGRWYERDADGAETQWGSVLAWEPPGRLLLNWQLDGSFAYDPNLLTEVELTFTPAEGGGTLVTLEHRKLENFGASAASHAERLRNGWPTKFDGFANYANAGGSSMSEFIVHSVPGSPFGRAVLTALVEKGAAFRLAPLMPGALKSEPHILRHPFGRVPVLEHEGFMLYETQAILRYLDRVIATPGLTPADPRAAGRMDQVMNISDWYLFREVNAVIGFHRIVAPQLLGLQPDEKAIADALPKGRTTFRELSRLLGSQPYFAGSELSLADLLVAPHVDFLSATPEWQALTDEAANVVTWLQRMNARDSFKATTWERVTALAKAA